MLEISLDETELKRGLGQLLRNATDTRPMMWALATEMQSMTEDNFSRERWGGKRWQKNKRGGKTLQLSGQLAASISTKVSSRTAQIGTNKPYAAIHHLGGTILPKNKPYLVFPVPGGFRKVKQVTLPPRPYLPIDGSGQLQPDGENRLLDVAIASLKKGI